MDALANPPGFEVPLIAPERPQSSEPPSWSHATNGPSSAAAPNGPSEQSSPPKPNGPSEQSSPPKPNGPSFWSKAPESPYSPAEVAQHAWAAQPIRARLAILRRTRHLLAARTAELCAAIPTTLSRNPADTLVAELLPLLDACRFLERRAAHILRPRHLGRRGLPWWLGSLHTRIDRVPFGQILIIAPANYPLFLPGVQALQALAAGNAVIWKPGSGGRPVADLVASTLKEAGLPHHLLTITDDTPEAAREAIAGKITGTPPDKVILTGSFTTGREVVHLLAESAIPCVAELSGCDAVIALPSADLDRLTAALAFGMRLNGSATCMAPRRLFLLNFTPARRDTLLDLLRTAFAQIPPIPISPATTHRLDTLLRAAREHGATVFDDAISLQKDLSFRPEAPSERSDPKGHSGQTRTSPPAKDLSFRPEREARSGETRISPPPTFHLSPTLITNATPRLEITQTDIFAPVLSVLEVPDRATLLAAEAVCPYALTAAIFGAQSEALALAPHLHTNTVLINDLIIPTADPRLPFTPRRRSGFGSTRGAEGLLEMTLPRTTTIRRGSTQRQYAPTTPDHIPFFEAMIRLTHSASWRERAAAAKQFLTAARKLK